MNRMRCTVLQSAQCGVLTLFVETPLCTPQGFAVNETFVDVCVCVGLWR